MCSDDSQAGSGWTEKLWSRMGGLHEAGFQVETLQAFDRGQKSWCEAITEDDWMLTAWVCGKDEKIGTDRVQGAPLHPSLQFLSTS